MTKRVQSQSRSVLSVGHVVLDVVIHERGIGHSAGGTAGNVAANLSCFGWDSAVAALYGDDPAGDHLRADLGRAGVSHRALLRREAYATPVVIHEIDDGRHRYKFGCPTCGRKFPQFRAIPVEFAKHLCDAQSPDVLFVDRVSSSAVFLADWVRRNGGLVFFEPSMPLDSPRFRRLMSLAHVLKFSAEQLDPTSPLLCDAPPTLIYTDGADGAYWRNAEQSWRHVPAYPVEVIDAGGAGDWTTAAFLNSLSTLSPAGVAATDLTEPLCYAQAVASLSCQTLGARGLRSVLDSGELDARVKQIQSAGTRQGSADSKRPSKSRRHAACSACLAGEAHSHERRN